MVGGMNLAVGAILWMGFVPVTVMTVNTHPLPILYTAGDTVGGRSIAYWLDYCKTNDATATVTRELRDVTRDRLVPLSVVGYVLPSGCHRYEVVEPVPSSVPLGRYRLRLTFSYRPARYRNVPPVFESEPFEVR